MHFNRVNVTDNFSFDHLGLTNCLPNSSSDRFTTYAVYRLAVEVGIVGTLCLFGFVGSSLTIVILRLDKDKNNTTTWLLQVLAVVDILYLTACLFIQPVRTLYTVLSWYPGYHLHHAYLYLESYAWFAASIIQTITIWVVILVTADRYLAICKPLTCRKLRTIRNCRLGVGAVVVLAVLYNIPQVLDRDIALYEEKCTKKPVWKSSPSSLRYNPLYFLLYKTLCNLAFRSLGPLLTLVGLNSRLMAALTQLRARRRSLTRLGRAAASNGENLTLMLVVVVTVFVVCELPDCCLRLATILLDYVDGLRYDADAVAYANVVANMLHAFNSSVNFLVYCFVGRKFRRLLAGLCGGGGGRTSEDVDPTNQGTSHAQAHQEIAHEPPPKDK